jgi:AcrR family transcriptional regulator
MGSQERRQRHKQQVRTAILEAAQRIATQEGWEAVTMRRLANEIEYTLPILYVHFKSKEEIIAELANVGLADLKGKLEAIQKQYTGHFHDAMLQMSLTYCHYAQDNKAMYEAMFGQNGVSSFTRENPVEGENLFLYIQQNLQTLVDNGVAKIPNTWNATKLVWGTLHGLVALNTLGRISDQSSDLESVVADFVDFLVKSWEIRER